VKDILIIDDIETDALLLERSLRTAGIISPIVHVSSGADALVFLNARERALRAGNQSELGVIFFDLKLPDGSGFDLLTLVLHRKIFSNTLKVIVSDLTDMEHVRTAYSLGADSFITKPPVRDDIKQLILGFPENWTLLDSPPGGPITTQATHCPQIDPYDQAVHVWAANREIIQSLRKNIQTLRTQLADNEETLAVIETLTDEFRSSLTSAAQSSKTRQLKTGI
jgi:CheY-like chemotaxis protein